VAVLANATVHKQGSLQWFRLINRLESTSQRCFIELCCPCFGAACLLHLQGLSGVVSCPDWLGWVTELWHVFVAFWPILRPWNVPPLTFLLACPGHLSLLPLPQFTRDCLPNNLNSVTNYFDHIAGSRFFRNVGNTAVSTLCNNSKSFTVRICRYISVNIAHVSDLFV
jgi:hypothetical protein